MDGSLPHAEISCQWTLSSGPDDKCHDQARSTSARATQKQLFVVMSDWQLVGFGKIAKQESNAENPEPKA